jgi:uncharacterized protein (UPF0335 family)
MRYIKVFEKFDGSMSKIKQDIDDMFIELTDEGYEVDIKMIGTLQVSVKIKKPKEHNIEEVEDYILMFIDYMNDLWSGSYFSTTYEYKLNAFTKELNHLIVFRDSSKLDFSQWSDNKKPIGWISSEIEGITCLVTKIVTKRNFR